MNLNNVLKANEQNSSDFTRESCILIYNFQLSIYYVHAWSVTIFYLSKFWQNRGTWKFRKTEAP